MEASTSYRLGFQIVTETIARQAVFAPLQVEGAVERISEVIELLLAELRCSRRQRRGASVYL
jgi:hypothetical protein